MQNSSYKISKKLNISYINIIGSMQNAKLVNIFLFNSSFCFCFKRLTCSLLLRKEHVYAFGWFSQRENETEQGLHMF